MILTQTDFQAVYGPVHSWRYGRSLGIDPIGPVSTCSFRCVYCQLGEIEHHTDQRSVFVATDVIARQLQAVATAAIDVVTLSGSGEPTLALNLGEILAVCGVVTGRPTVVLTNGTLLGDRTVQQELQQAAKVAVKVDALTPAQLQGINSPRPGYDLAEFWHNLAAFRARYSGELAIQTMLLSPWSAVQIATYVERLRAIAPDEIQLNVPRRPKPQQHCLEGRENQRSAQDLPLGARSLACVPPATLRAIAQAVREATGLRVRCAPQGLS